MWRSRLATLLVLTSLTACGGEDTEEGPLDITRDQGPTPNCVEGVTLCNGQTYSICRGGIYEPVEVCESMCVPGVGCGACDPASPQVCVGDDLYSCSSEGALSAQPVQTCDSGCMFDACVGGCDEGSELIYVVDSDNTLLSFDPRTLAFNRLGVLNCPAALPWPDWSRNQASPFSMSVDRFGRAWVLYTSGEIFWVDINNNLACERSPFVPGTEGFELFGMGFVTDTPGGNNESLYIAGGPVGSLERGQLARVDPNTLTVERLGPLNISDFGPELTGNGDAELWGYFPGGSPQVARIDKGSGADEERWRLPGFVAQPRAWAFAHWGGRYHVFITDTDGFGNLTSEVIRFDPVAATAETVATNLPYVIVGAGVSTCAPTVSNF
ncbi:MAG: hypothetical protein ACE366_31040 [Bradymonadia bacterium]